MKITSAKMTGKRIAIVMVVFCAAVCPLAKAGISDHVYFCGIWQIWDYNDPTDGTDLTFEFNLEMGTDTDVVSVEFITPASKTFQIPKEPGHWSDGIWTSYEYDPDWDEAEWRFRAKVANLTDLQQTYGDGDYTIKVYYQGGGQDLTTVWFGIPDTQNPLPQPTQEPALTFPVHHQTANSPVTLTWNSCTDTKATDIWIEMQEQGTGAVREEGFEVNETSWGPVVLTDGLWQAVLAFEHWALYSISDNGNGIWVGVGKSSQSRYEFTVVGCPWTKYEVWGGDTFLNYGYSDIDALEANGYVKLGESDGQTADFPGARLYYVIGSRGQFLLDSIKGSDGSYYSSFEPNCGAYNVSDEDNILGPPDGQYATVGGDILWDDEFSGYIYFTNPNNWTGITVITTRIIGDFCGPPGSGPPDGYVDYWDLLYFAQRWHTRPGDLLWDPRCDLSGPNGDPDGYIDYWDLLDVAQHWHDGQKP